MNLAALNPFYYSANEQHWVNNHKKRHAESDTGSSRDASCPTNLLKRRKLRKTSAYNAFSKEFHQQGSKILCVCW